MKISFILFISFLIFLIIIVPNSSAQSKLKDNPAITRLTLSKDLKYNDKNPFQAGIASFIVPGFAFGQLYNEQYNKFAIHVGITLGCAAALLLLGPHLQMDFGGNPPKGPWGWAVAAALVYVSNWIYSIVDSVVTANDINRRNEYLNKARTQLDKFELGFATNEQKKLQAKLKLNL